MTAYYNENDPKAAAWLRELIKHGHIAPGDVDERSIEDVTPNDLRGYKQCHFFAGIGGWSYALRLAGVADDRAVRTGSCPCQPFSAAGKGAGFADERHLWPAWHYLIEQLAPPVIFGEQVASPAGLGWFDLVYSDMEETGYACAAVDLCAAGVGAPHIRQRLYWVAHNDSGRRQEQWGGGVSNRQWKTLGNDTDRCGADGDVAEPEGQQPHGHRDTRGRWGESTDNSVLGHAAGERLEGRSVSGGEGGSKRTPWSPSDVIWCRDGKWRPVEPGTFPLAHGVPGRVGLLRGYGNAIVPQAAAAFIEATGVV